MIRGKLNQLRPALLATALVTAIVVVVLWSAASTRTSLADEAPVRSSIESLAQTPTSQTWSPERDAIITQKDPLTISGYAWESGVTPPFLTEDPMLSIQRVNERSYYVGWTAVLSAEQYTLQEAITPDFSVYTSTLVPHPTTNELITKEAQDDDTYYYRVQATRFGLGPSRWSNVASVVVPWTLTSSDLAPSTSSASLATNGSLTVEVRIDDGEWHTATVTDAGWTGGGGWGWSYVWSPLPEENNIQHRIETRATDAVGSVSPVDAITITVDNERHFVYLPFVSRRWPPIPYTPMLNDINNPTKADNYTVSWSYDPGSLLVNVDSFTLQEDRDASFTDPTEYSTSETSHAISGKTPGTYYYRVRGVNAYGPGEWSNVVSTQVMGDYFDHFADASSGWTTHKAESGLTDCDGARQNLEYKYDLYYQGGRYKVHVPLDCRGGGEHGDTRHIYPVAFPPGITRPSTRTCVGMEGSFEIWDPVWSFWGIAFAVSDDKSIVYSLEVNNMGDWAILRREGYQYPGPNHPYLNETRTPVEPGADWTTDNPRWPAEKAFKHNKLKVEIANTEVIFYINDVRAYTINKAATVNEIRSLRNVGIIGGNWEITPTQIGYDYFFVDVGCDNY